ITAIECTSADGQFLKPSIIWPTHFQEIWEGSSNFGWYHEQSKDGYLDRNVILKWITETFEPQTKARAKGSIPLLISDALSDYNTRFVEKFCEKKTFVYVNFIH
ncbi:uncharacterized protein K444DRAFT_534686, partial [Hyaloscypha bicolor E]